MPKQNISPTDYPQAVLQEIARLAQHMVVARKRRGETQAQWARKLGVSQPTMARLERGDPSVAMASYVMCLWLIRPSLGLADLVAPAQDHAALEREVAQVRQTLRPRKARALTPELPTPSKTKPTATELASMKELLAKSQPTATELASMKELLAKSNPTAAGLAALLGVSGKKTG